MGARAGPDAIGIGTFLLTAIYAHQVLMWMNVEERQPVGQVRDRINAL
ncbi:MAG: hypothetical protein HY320_03695 [Armatimonadetes bacterium]|nr:hypothetical protein [Armatimonadota bacterium]